MYLKRNSMPKTWPLARKGTEYLAVPKHNLKTSMALLVILRDVLKVVKNKKEARRILESGKIKINGKVIKEERFPVGLLDIINLNNKNLKLIIHNRKFNLVESKEEEKIAKIIGKKILKKGKIQINLSDGRNYLVKEKINVGDSIVIDLKENKISEVLPFKINSKIMFISGKHLGETGKIEEIDKNKVLIKIGDEKINSRLENLMVIK